MLVSSAGAAGFDCRTGPLATCNPPVRPPACAGAGPTRVILRCSSSNPQSAVSPRPAPPHPTTVCCISPPRPTPPHLAACPQILATSISLGCSPSTTCGAPRAV